MQKLRIRDSSIGRQAYAFLLVESPAVANIKSQIKRNRQNEAARLRNKAVRSALKTSAKKTRVAIRSEDADGAQGLLRDTTQALDRAASKGVIHKRTAARRKSRLARAASSATG
jgi:small subunit ribosomal protein S20